MSESREPGQPAAEPPRRGRVSGWLTRVVSRHLHESWAEYQAELGEFTRLSERPAPGLAAWHGLRAEVATRRAFRAGDTALLDRALGLRPEEKRNVAAVQQMVDAAFGEFSALPLWGGYKQQTLNVHKELAAKTNVFVRDLTNCELEGISDSQLKTIKGMIPKDENQFIMSPSFSDVMDRPLHVETVRNLFTAAGQPHAAGINMYRYVSVARGKLGNGRIAKIAPDGDFLPIERYVVGFAEAREDQEPRPVGLVSLAPTSQEFLAMLDKGIRMEPETELPENPISAITRIHDLVLSDCAMQRAA